MIEIRNLFKTFYTSRGPIDVLKGIDLKVKQGEILGIIGPSGAGKSTLLRCMNFLEKPTRGSVSLDGEILNYLSTADLRRIRQKTGMIFQEFNLFRYQTVFQNVLFPLEIKRVFGSNAKKRVFELLDLVGISEKANDFPAQLSGGQKQRVGIARALACDPKILFCDEATSSLDEKNSLAILNLLRKINREFDLTVVLITHEKKVVQKICERVISLEKGKIKEVSSLVFPDLPPQAQKIKEQFPGARFFLLESEPSSSGLLQLKGEKVWENKDKSLWRLDWDKEEKDIINKPLEIKGVII